MSLVFWGKLTTGQKTREHSWVVGSYQLILATSLSQLCSKVTADSLGHGPHPPWAVRGCPRHRWQPLLGGTIVPRCLELPTPALPCPDVAGHCRWQLCDHQTKVNSEQLQTSDFMNFFSSEIAPATASAISQLLPKYLDQVNWLVCQTRPEKRLLMLRLASK